VNKKNWGGEEIMMKKDKNVVQSVFAKLICMLVVLLIVFGNTINVYADTSDNGKMWYSTSASYTFNVKGYYNGSLLRTTYADAGYQTYIKVNGSETSLGNFSYNGALQTYNGITIQQNLSFVSNGNYVKIEYVLTNNNSSATTISLAAGADVMIGSNDHAPIENLTGNKGFRMSGDGAQFMFIGRDSYGVTNVDTYWFGTYSSWRNNKYVQSYTYQGSFTDSGMAWSWQNKTIQPGETQKYSVLIGIGILNEPPTLNVTSSVKDTYYRGEIVNIQGTVNDIDYGDVLTVKYAVDDGTEYSIGQTFTPNGSAKPFDLNFTIPTNLSVGAHQLKIWVADDKGNMSSPKVVNFTVSPFAPPTAPTYKNITQNSFTVEWGTNGNDSGVIYELYDVTDNKTVYSGTGTSVTLSGFSPNEKRQYKARTKNNHGSYSDYTSVTTVYTNAIQPLSKGYDNITSNSVRLLWNPNGNSSYTNYHYEVRKKSDNSVVAQGTVNGTSVTVTGLTGGHEQYRYFVRAISGNGTYTDFTELIIPSLNVYQKSNYAKAEWAIEMEDSDILTMTSFEDGQERPTFTWGSWGLGGQSLTTEDAYEGQYSVKVQDTITNGNHINFPATYSSYSIMMFGRKYFPNGTDLSLSFNAKSTGTGTITAKGDGGWATTIFYYNNKVAENAPVGSKVIKVDSLTGLYVGSFITTDTDPNSIIGMYQIIEINTQNNTITLNSGINKQYNAGEQLRYRVWRGAFNFGSRTVNSNQWTLFNINTKVNDYDDYDVLTRGGSFYIDTMTGNIVYLDNIKFGYATKAELYRDGTKVYEGFLSDYDDYVAVDKVAPNPVSKINVANNGNTINVTFDTPSDKGTTYNYQVKAVKHNGDVIGSEVKPITVISGIKGYSYVIDSIPNTTPDNIVEVTAPNINHTINPNVKNYIHIKVIDNEGNVSSVFHQEIGIPVLTATPNHAEDYIHLDWDIKDNSKEYTYMVYKKAEGENEYQTIPVKDTLKVLEIYPSVSVLKGWTDAFGLGKITTTSVSIENFNSNPNQIWNYDVIVFGFADSNGGKDITMEASSVVEDFIKSGRGVLFGHDTLRGSYFPGFERLSKYVNMTYSSNPWTSQPWNNWKNHGATSNVVIARKGFLTNYPYKIGDIGTVLTIPYTHTLNQIPGGDVWLRFAGEEHIENYYLTTWNNVAMIQTGHSGSQATVDEQKLIVNTLFYLGQITSETSLDDHTGQDVTGPTKPTITDVRMINNGNTIHVEYTSSEDIGTKYYYYVEGTAPNTKVQSNIADATIKSGLKGYSIVVDQNPSTVPDNAIETTSLEYDINQRFYQKFYVHVAAVDNVGNISDVAHYECTDTVPPTLNVTGNATTWTNQDVILTAVASDNESGVRGIKLPNGEWIYSDTATFVVTVNGNYTFVAEDNFGNQTTVTVSVTKIDKTPPLNTSIIINNNDLYTNNRNVVLTVSAEDNATGVSEMRFRTENSPWSAWVPYSTTFGYTMDAGFTHQGTNRVYVQFKDGVGNVGGDAFDSIIFDNIAPTGEIIYPKNTTNTRSITLTINAYDINPASADAISGLNSVRFRELQDGVVKQDWTSWEQHNFTRNWILSDGDGVKVIEMEIRDNAGNIGKVSKSIVLDTLFIKEALFTDIVNPPLGNPELPTSEVVKVKKGYEFTFIVKTTGEPDYATYTFNGETGYMIKLADNLFTKTLKVDINDDSVDNELLPINITAARNDGTQKTTTLKVHVEGSAYDDFNINLTN
jgi:hypothetical protein